jgi:hypothetical protein
MSFPRHKRSIVRWSYVWAKQDVFRPYPHRLDESQLVMHYESAPCFEGEHWLPAKTSRGFAPAPPGFCALVPLPIGDSGTAKGDAEASYPSEQRILSCDLV